MMKTQPIYIECIFVPMKANKKEYVVREKYGSEPLMALHTGTFHTTRLTHQAKKFDNEADALVHLENLRVERPDIFDSYDVGDLSMQKDVLWDTSIASIVRKMPIEGNKSNTKKGYLRSMF